MPQEALEDELLALAALESDDDAAPAKAAAPADAAGAAAASAVPAPEEAAAPSTAEGDTEVGSPPFSDLESLVTALDRANAPAGNRMLAPLTVASSSLAFKSLCPPNAQMHDFLCHCRLRPQRRSRRRRTRSWTRRT